jgi:hypothetical protein
MASRVDLFAAFGAISGCFHRGAAPLRDGSRATRHFLPAPLHFAFIMPR